MLKTIIVPVQEVSLFISDSSAYSDLGALNKIKDEEYERIFTTYGMPVPTHLQLQLSQELLNKMIAVKNISNLYNLKKIEFYSKDRNNTNRSFANIFNGDTKIETTYYEEAGKFPCYNNESFRLIYDSFYEQFCVEFYYINSYIECPFSTHYFDINN